MKVATTITTMVLTLALAGCGDASPGHDDEAGHAKKRRATKGRNRAPNTAIIMKKRARKSL